MWYKVDWDRLILLLLPTFLRQPKLFAFVKALLSPVASLHYDWKLMREANLQKLSYNGQKCYLRKALNDYCDNDLRRIYIGATDNIPPAYIYTQDENQDVYLGTMFIDTDFNYAGTTVDFLVFVPAEFLETKINELNYLLEFYTLAGKKYEILPI